MATQCGASQVCPNQVRVDSLGAPTVYLNRSELSGSLGYGLWYCGMAKGSAESMRFTCTDVATGGYSGSTVAALSYGSARKTCPTHDLSCIAQSCNMRQCVATGTR